LRPWEIPVLDVTPQTRPENLPCAYAESLPKVRKIRQALHRALRDSQARKKPVGEPADRG
jgi:hypothetical protein